jgi:putative ABC transport system substrate-binding protein
MKRRATLLAVATLAAPWLCSAQLKAPRVGVLSPGGPHTDPGFPLDDPAVLWKRLGWTEGESLFTLWRFAEFRVERLPELVDDLLHRQSVDLLLAIGPEAAAAAARATRTVPIVFIWSYLPIEMGLIDSYARPGRNATGVALSDGLDVSNKRIEFLRTVTPDASRIAILVPDFRDYTVSGVPPDLWSRGEATARAHGFDGTGTIHVARRPEDVDGALADAAAARAQLALIGGVAYSGAPARVVEFALRQRWITSTISSDLFNAGLLMYYGPSQLDHRHIWARGFEIADRVLRGTKPADIPVELPTRYEFALNLKTARALGVAIPQSIAIRADRVIE